MRGVALLAVALFAVSPLKGQTPIYPSASAGGGIDVRVYDFGRGASVDEASQLVVPLFAGVPLGRRLFVDLTANYASTRVEGAAGASAELKGLTDSQLRLSYTLGRDRAVFSLGFNLPTGETKVRDEQVAVLGTTAQTFLPFTVSNYGAGFGVTGGATVAYQLGRWNVGAAGSLRHIGSYEPLAAPDSARVSYDPGIEGRVRVGVDRLIGERARFTAGFTLSTYSRDEFEGAQSFGFSPGSRYIAEANFARQLGRSTLQVYGWAYFRGASRVSDAPPELADVAGEQVYHGGVVWAIPIGARVRLDPGVEVRYWYPDRAHRGRLFGVRLGARLPVFARLAVAPSVRWDEGWLVLPESGFARVTAWKATLLLRAGR